MSHFELFLLGLIVESTYRSTNATLWAWTPKSIQAEWLDCVDTWKYFTERLEWEDGLA